MAQQYNTAMASSPSAPVTAGSEQSMALTSTSTTVTNTSSGTPPPAAQSMALIPTSSPASTALTTTANASVGMSAAAGQPPLTSTPPYLQGGEEAWSVVTRALMVAVMGSQPPAMAASTLLGVFQPMVDGWAAARKEGKRWKERSEVYMAEHHKHKIELANKHDSLQTQLESLQQNLEESQSRVRELESQQSVLRANVSALEKKLGDAEAQARAAKEAHAQELQECKKEVEAMAKSSQDAKFMHQKLRQEADNKARDQNAEIAKLQDKSRENDAIKSKLEERLGSIMAKNTSLEAELAQKGQEISNLQTRITEVTTRKEALERQLALYQRIPTRRF